jgi:hypothetical protein
MDGSWYVCEATDLAVLLNVTVSGTNRSFDVRKSWRGCKEAGVSLGSGGMTTCSLGVGNVRKGSNVVKRG